MALKLRDRILTWSIASTLVIMLVVLLLVDSIFQSTIRSTLEENLRSGTGLVGELRRSRVDAWITEIVEIALEPTLRASLETGDPVTIEEILETARQNVRAEWLAVASPEGELLARSGAGPFNRISASRSLLDEAVYYDTGDLWYQDGQLFDVGVSSLVFGPLRLGVLLGGRRVDSAVADELSTQTGHRIAFLAGGELVAGDSLLGSEDAGDLLQTDWSVDADRAEPGGLAVAGRIREFSLADETFLGQPLALLGARTEVVGSLVVFRSLDAALAPVGQLRSYLIMVGLGGTVVALTFSLVLTRSVTHPVSQLLTETERLGAGELDHPIEPVNNDEIGMLASGFERMRVSLREARVELIRRERLSAVGQAASALVHDFAQPITLIGGHTDLLAMGEGDATELQEDVAAIRSALGRLQGMMREVLEFARGEVRIEITEISVEGLLEEVVRRTRPVVEGAGISIDVDHGYTGPWMLDDQRTTRALGNLVRNAASAMAGKGLGRMIRLRSARADRHLRLEVEDDGPGIPEEIQETLFEPFVTRGTFEGTGLGLAIVKNIAENQGGRVAFRTSAKGTTFVIELPEAAPPETRS